MKLDDVHVKVTCDSSELDAALAKLALLAEKAREANVTLPTVAMTMVAAATQAEQQRVSRRGLLFWWRR